ncbi:unnamed protein product [Vitrella brassicaformis CCMP3155]|uniref:Protein kinase domain-containing protein n=1 Tax=Vitrella brassicaformis (strain CCMP3155) TaxID=1169540 RepID=A0A0G4G3Z3_VITBC|nr:unnamed protein product [Vitrella brassicaformis CCMP3155]|mmetsp:Transcript_15450/g.36770  ORF Transcript_15450/g.36770 Transcript_15450/m.36770 type:complete len:512 (-) Transcript_15450:354-1889(-)|eukprot:CEM23152.1 unnamed protein product [Vitrella brassicaformis CCMP3155]
MHASAAVYALCVAFLSPPQRPLLPTTTNSLSYITPPRLRCGGALRMVFSDVERRAAYPSSTNSFKSSDFLLDRYLGAVGVITIRDWAYYDETTGEKVSPNPFDPRSPRQTTDESSAMVRLFQARLIPTGLPGYPVLLKEYATDARHLAETELDIYGEIIEDYNARKGLSEKAVSFPPVVPGLGRVEADPYLGTNEFQEQWKRQVAFRNVPPPRPGNIWTVLQWPGPLTFDTYDRLGRGERDDVLDGVVPGFRLKRKSRFLKMAIRRALEAIDYLHQLRIVHRSISPGSFVLQDANEREPLNVKVLIQDFGFATTLQRLARSDDDDSVRRAMKVGAVTPAAILDYLKAEDLKSSCVTFLYFIVANLYDEAAAKRGQGKGGSDTGNKRMELTPGGFRQTSPRSFLAVRRLVEEVFDGDMSGLRDYWLNDEPFADVVKFLDQNDMAGWDFLSRLYKAPQLFQQQVKDTQQRGGEREISGDGGKGEVTERERVYWNARDLQEHPFLGGSGSGSRT